MQSAFLTFLERHNSLVFTTHSGADPDGLGAELVLAEICRGMGKKIRIINANPVPNRYCFMDPDGEIESWENLHGPLPQGSALVMLDTSDEYNIGPVRDFIASALEVFVLDHHEPNPFNTFNSYIDRLASSVCELTVEIAMTAGHVLSKKAAVAAYAGIIYDTGSFAFPRTTARTFKAALILLAAGVSPYDVYHELYETSSTTAILLHKIVLSSLQLYNEGRVAVQILRKEDLEVSAAEYEDAQYLVNIPLKAKDIVVSVLIKENRDGEIRCSLRSKGKINVSKLAQSFSGGGHVSAAGFRSKESIEATLDKILKKITELLKKTQT